MVKMMNVLQPDLVLLPPLPISVAMMVLVVLPISCFFVRVENLKVQLIVPVVVKSFLVQMINANKK